MKADLVGAIPSLLEHGGARRVIAVERDERALGPLQAIAARYPGRLEIVCADALTFDPRPLLGSERAKIVANLPYIAPEDPDVAPSVRDYEPHLALYSPDGGLEHIQRLLAQAPTALRPNSPSG